MEAVQAPGDGLEAFGGARVQVELVVVVVVGCGGARDQVGLVCVVIVAGCHSARDQVGLVLVVVVVGCGTARDQVVLVLV